MDALFHARVVRGSQFHALTKDAVYPVVDSNDYFGTYTVIDDNGKRCRTDRDRFERMPELEAA